MIEQRKRIRCSEHAWEQMRERGARQEETETAILKGEQIPAKKGRKAFRHNFQFNAEWGNKHYAIKQVMPIVVEEGNEYIVVTVYTFYF